MKSGDKLVVTDPVCGMSITPEAAVATRERMARWQVDRRVMGRRAPGESSVGQGERYIPALNRIWLTPLYDPLLRWGMREEQFKAHLIRQADIRPGDGALDLGCGTGTLTVTLKQGQPRAEVVGLDGDPQVLALARAKAEKASVAITWDDGLAYRLPYLDGGVDRVVSSLVIHHLTTDNKRRSLAETLRVLHLIDIGPPHTANARLIPTRFR